MHKRSFAVPGAFLVASLLPACCFGQSSTDLPRIGVGISSGTLGEGIEIATAVTKKSNVRVGFNYLSFSLSGTTNDQLGLNGTLRLESGEALYDQYFGPFHVSGGVLLYDGNQATGSVSVPGGHSFTLNDHTYYSAVADPFTGHGAVTFNKVAPELLIGFGNMLPRSARHFSATFDLGAAFQGSPNAKLNMTGSTCPNNGTTGCVRVGSNSTLQNDILAEQNKTNNSLAPFKYYPVLRLTFGYKF